MINRVSTRFRPAPVRSVIPVMVMVLVILIAACSSDDSDAVPTVTPVPQTLSVASLDELISLAPGEAVEINGENIVLAFHRVADDSRCPAGSQCVTAGTAVVVLSLKSPGFDPGQIEFLVPPGGGGFTLAGPYGITLQSLEPDPPPNGGVEPDGYRITIIVSKE